MKILHFDWVAESDSCSIAKVMVTVIKDGLNYNQNSKKNTRLAAETLFDWKKVNARILKKYKSLIT